MKQKYRVEINVSVQQTEPYFTGGRLEIRESVDLSANGFFELAVILSRFHDLAEVLKAEQTIEAVTNG